MSKRFYGAAFAIGLATVAWIGLGFVGSNAVALAMTLAIAGVYGLGAWELRQFRAANAALASCVAPGAPAPATLDDWLAQVPAALRHTVRARIEGGRGGLPGPALTPYLVGLLVMLGMLGTFLGMVVTFKGAVFALEGSSDLQAMRAALAEPIKGLGLSFGTSVAGVAASAMLGLMSAISRRERLEIARLLDTRIATELRAFSLVHQRQETFRSLQAQATALPEVARQLEALMDRIEKRSQQLDEHLLQRQASLHHDVTQAYTELARSVGVSLQDSLKAGATAAGASITPVVQAAMTQIVQESHSLQARLGEVAHTQVERLSAELTTTARTVADTWQAALQDHARTSDTLASGLRQALGGFTETFEQRSAALLADVRASRANAQAEEHLAEQQRLQAWTQALHALAADLQAQWQLAGDQALARQQAVSEALARSAAEVADRVSAQAGGALDDVTQLLARSEALVRSRVESEAQWAGQQGERMDQLATLWRTQLEALRHDEALRGQAAVDRLGELQAAVAGHLATLGASLEAPLTRLLHTASEVPQAAAGVISQLREEMSRLSEKDNLALQERTALLQQLGALLQAIQQASGEQGAAIEALVTSASATLAQAGDQFAQTLEAQAGRAGEMATHVAGSAVEMASLAEGFGHGVERFQATSDKLLEGLQRIETSINRSTARSDEQLAYYVAQAREVIDLSIASQQGLVESLRQLQAQAQAQSQARTKAPAPATTEGAAG